MMIKGMTSGALWRRGWWVILMLMANAIVICSLSVAVGFLLQPLSAHAFEIADALVGFTVGPIVLGLLFETLASELPRLRHTARANDAV